MRVEVIKTFLDKEDNELKRVGLEYTTNKDRYAEVNSHPEGPFLKNLDEKEVAEDDGGDPCDESGDDD